jgi:two-component system response regulator DegU
MKTIKVLVAYDSCIFCEAISKLLQKEPDIEVVGRSEDCPEVMQDLDHGPDVLILGPSLFDPAELPKRVLEIKGRSPRTRILLFLDEEISDISLMRFLMQGGIDGYIRSSDTSTHLIAAVRSVSAGNIWADRKLLNKFVHCPPLPATTAEARLSQMGDHLTKREKEIISLLLLGLPNKALSERLNISEKTVKTHLNSIYRKMKVNNRTQVVTSLFRAY